MLNEDSDASEPEEEAQEDMLLCPPVLINPPRNQ